ncbi:hypothetical protein QL285_028869 [Trifolium repens]|nr:hypothetical protein QL285_028869 [Trifolium repens]
MSTSSRRRHYRQPSQPPQPLPQLPPQDQQPQPPHQLPPQHQQPQPPTQPPLPTQPQPQPQPPPLPQPPQPHHSHWIVDVIDADGNFRQKHLEVQDLIPNKVGFKVLTNWNDVPQPVGEAAGLLAGYLGFLASNDDLFPIMYRKWPKVPTTKKDLVYETNIKAKFVVNDQDHRKFIYSSLGKKWKDYRSFLFNRYYDWSLSVEQNIENFPGEVTKDHWAMYLEYRLHPDTMRKANQNAKNRQKQCIPHTLGRKSLARTRDDMEKRDERTYSRGDMYEISHKKRNGVYVNDEARKKNEELQKEIHASNSVNGAFVKVFGKEHNGYVRGLGLGVTPSQIFGHSSRPSSVADAKIAKMQSEIDVLSKQVAEVEALKAKVAEFEQLKKQFAFIMANIKGNHVHNIGSPYEIRRH